MSNISGPPITTIPSGGNEIEEVRTVDEKVKFNLGNYDFGTLITILNVQ